jgi:hypothetical protein
MNTRALPAVLAVSTALVLTACGGSHPAGNSTAAGGSAAPPGSSSGPAAAGAAKHGSVCAALPVAVASQITGTTFTTSKANSVAGVIFGCEYQGPDSALLQVSFETSNGRVSFDADIKALKTVGHPPNRISGVGDEAFSEPDPRGNAGSVGASAFASFGAVFGDTYVKIGGLTYVSAGQGKQIAERLHEKF